MLRAYPVCRGMGILPMEPVIRGMGILPMEPVIRGMGILPMEPLAGTLAPVFGQALRRAR